MFNADQKLTYDWLLQHLRILKAEGVLMVPDLTPLSTEQIVAVLEAIKDTEAYERQTISIPDRNGLRSILRYANDKGVIEEGVVQDEDHPQRQPYGTTVVMDEPEVPDAP